MTDAWTSERILTLAPDPASAKAGKDLATPRKWVSFGRDDRAIWGECQGSGSKPYQTQIDLSEPAFKCSCPSRKFPCKHGLALFLLATSAPPAPSTPPKWVEEWLTSRGDRATKKAEKQAAAAAGQATTPDPEAQAKRAADRERKISAGVEELDLWLRDLIRQGLAAAQSQPYSFWESRAARLVDAQAPGLARLLRDMAGTPATGDGWQSRLLSQLARLHLAIEAFRRRDSLPPGAQDNLRSVLGIPVPQEQVLARPGLRDRWTVLAQRVTTEDRLRAQRTYLIGDQSKRPALLLQFAHGNQPFPQTLLPGTRLDATLSFFPGSPPLRALLKDRHSPPEPIESPSVPAAKHAASNTRTASPTPHLAGSLPSRSSPTDMPPPFPSHPTLTSALAEYATALSQNPWIEDYPFPLSAVAPTLIDNRWYLTDPAGDRLPLHPRFPHPWHLLSLSGGHPLPLFAEWTGHHLLPLSTFAHNEFLPLNPGDA